MTIRTFYRIALLLPLAAPVALAYAGFLPAVVLTIGFLYYGPAYVLFALWASWRAGRYDSASALRNFALRLPLVFAPLAALAIGLTATLGGTGTFKGIVTDSPLIAIIAAVMAYVYVLPVVGIAWALERNGWIVERVRLTSA